MSTKKPAEPGRSAATGARKRRTDGERSRRAILHAAAQLATTRGLESLSIGELASHIGMSKSGLYAHFKSKEELELATIETAVEIFQAEVLGPVLSAEPGVVRLRALTDGFLSHLERRVFPGGCFFAAVAAELDTRPGKARDRIMRVHTEWMGLIERCIREAQGLGEIDPGLDAAQLAFEADGMLVGANFGFVLFGDPKILRRARIGIDRLLAGAAKPSAKPRARTANRG